MDYLSFYITILEQVNCNELPDTVVADTTSTYQSVLDLIEVGYLTGTPDVTAEGPVIRKIAITESGLRFLERNAGRLEQQTETYATTALQGLLWSSLAIIASYICLVTVLKYWL